MVRERSKIQLRERDGLIQEAAQMTRALDSWSQQSKRVPLLVRDSGGRWHWRGLRAVYVTHGGGERVTVDGRQCMAQRRSINTDRRVDAMVWVVDDTPALISPARFEAPLPLDCKADGLAYYSLGVHGIPGEHAAERARVLGWRGAGAIDAAERLLLLVHAMVKDRPADEVARLRMALPDVIIPGASGLDQQSRKTLQAEVEDLRAEVEELRVEVARLASLVI